MLRDRPYMGNRPRATARLLAVPRDLSLASGRALMTRLPAAWPESVGVRTQPPQDATRHVGKSLAAFASPAGDILCPE